MAERGSAAGAKGYKRLCSMFVLVPVNHVDIDDRERYSDICTDQTRGLLGASVFIELGIKVTGTSTSN